SGLLYGYGRAPGIADFSGRWRVAELEFGGAPDAPKGRAISALAPIGYLYGDPGIDVPRCDGPNTAALTSAADVPETLTVADPAPDKRVEVLPRKQAFELLAADLSGPWSKADQAAKLINENALRNGPASPPSGDLVWVVVPSTKGTGDLETHVFVAATGAFE